MMNNEYLKAYNDLCEKHQYMFDHSNDIVHVGEDTFGIIKDAIDKQVPKKIKYSKIKVAHCPVCNNSFLKDKCEYCCDCGQRLDWED